MNINVEDCTVCFTIFDDIMRRPRTLPCGHTFCTICLNALKEQGEVQCPKCRLSHAVPEAGQFPVSYITEAFVKRLRCAALATPPHKPVKDTAEPATLQASERWQEGTVGLSRPVQSLLQEQETKILAAIHTCQEIQIQLHDYQTTLVGWGERQQHLEDQLQALVDQSKSARVLVRQEESKVAVKREEEQQMEQQLHAVLQELRTVSTQPEAYKVVDDAVHHIDEEKQRMEECRAMFPDVHTVTTITKVKEASSAALEAATGVQAAQETAGSSVCSAGHSDQPSAPAYLITDRLKALITPLLKVMESASRFPPAAVSLITHNTPLKVMKSAPSAPPAAVSLLTHNTSCKVVESAPSAPPATVGLFTHNTSFKVEVKDLRSLTQPARNMLQDGLVFAVLCVRGQSWYARMSLKDGFLHLHSLEKQQLPTRAVTVQMKQLVPAAPPCLVFLDLAWPGSAPCRVLIRLDRDTTLGRQFILMCTGQRGTSYINTNLFRVWDDGRGRWRGVIGGDYQHNNGKGGAALLNLGSCQYMSLCHAGDVFWRSSGPSKGTQFHIITKASVSSNHHIFGKVVDGLEVVAAASNHRPITEVIVVDCGVVPWV